MYLKRLEIYGFKSFADKVKLDFQPGITAIVGPNGCGKSNITDAIRWVLGEQSAKVLRGSKMEDVIFKGSSSRKPLGIAEVAITIDNNDGKLPIDYSEVTIKRRIYKSGESEYYLNKTKCRLVDINKLLMDTGIGKEGYSIIGQGRIDEILKAKSEERRMIFEEAAGIVKFKSRKTDAEKKLDETEKNLTRLNDIIGEIENQMGPLKRQAVKAKKYMDLKEKLKETEVNLMVNRMLRIRKQLENLNDKSQHLENEIRNYDSKRAELQKQIEQSTIRLNEIEEQIYDNQNKAHEYSTQIQRIADEISRNIEKKENLITSNQELKKRQKQSQNSVELLKQRLEKERAGFSELKAKIREKQQFLNKKQVQLDDITENIHNDESDIEKNKSEVIDLLNEIAEKKNKLSSTTAIINNLTKEKEKIEQQMEKIKTELADIKQALTRSHEKIDETKTSIQQNNKKLQKNIKNIQQVEQEINKLNLQIDEKRKKAEAMVSRKNILENVEDLEEGLYEGVRNVLKAVKSKVDYKKGFCGIVADLLETRREYDVAIETALGSAMQYLVTESEKEAKHLINYLRKNSKGRATFLPITTVQPRYLSSSEYNTCKSVSGFVGSALEVITYDKKYEKVFANLLGRVVITRDIDAGLKIAKKTGYRFKIVTVKGDTINPGGSMTGGSNRRRNNLLLTRSRRIKELEKSIDNITKEIHALENHKAGLIKTLGKLKEETQKLQELQHKTEITLNTLAKEQEQLITQKEKLQDELVSLRKDYTETTETLEEMLDKLQEIKNQIRYKEKQSQHLQKTIEDHQNRYKQNRLNKDALADEITELKVELASMQENEKGLRERLTLLEDRISDELQRIENLENSIKDNSDLKQHLEKEIIELQDKKVQTDNMLEQVTSQINSLKKSKEEVKQKRENLDAEIKKVNIKIENLQKKIHELEVKETKIHVQYQNLENRLWELYNLSFQEGKKYMKEISDFNKIDKEVKILKSKIEGLGDVNVGAIEEYKHLKKRYDFLMSQRKDMIEAKDSLYRVIEEIEGKMRTRFVKNLKILNENFKEVFKELFGGGDARIVLLNPDEPLQSGIDIVAQPPGKKLQNLSLLSGGERSLTAIAILFAILKLKPSPFCVLDEIEAALDEANVERFSKYLRKLSAETQFIVVTHNKGTMEASQTLYGVSMEKNGVSRLVSVRLEDAS